MDLVSLFNFIFVAFTDSYTFFYVFDFLSSFLFKVFVLILYAPNCLFNLINFMAFELFGVLVDALHTHHSSLLLAVKH